MPKELSLPLVEKSIKTIINGHYGIKMNDLVIKLCHNLLTEDYEVSGDEIQNLVYQMITANQIIEVEYVVPAGDGRSRSFLLPAGSVISGMNTSTAYIAPPKPKLPDDIVRREDEMKTGYIAPSTT